MKQVTDFEPSLNLIIVAGEVSGPLGRTALRLVLDTGASETLLVPEIVDELGYSPRDAETVTGVYSAVGKEQGYILRVRSSPHSALPSRTSAFMSSISRIDMRSTGSSA